MSDVENTRWIRVCLPSESLDRVRKWEKEEKADFFLNEKKADFYAIQQHFL